MTPIMMSGRSMFATLILVQLCASLLAPATGQMARIILEPHPEWTDDGQTPGATTTTTQLRAVEPTPLSEGCNDAGGGCGGTFPLDLSSHGTIEFILRPPSGMDEIRIIQSKKSGSSEGEPIVVNFVATNNDRVCNATDTSQLMTGGILRVNLVGSSGGDTSSIASSYDWTKSYIVIGGMGCKIETRLTFDPALVGGGGEDGSAAVAVVGSIASLAWYASYDPALVGGGGGGDESTAAAAAVPTFRYSGPEGGGSGISGATVELIEGDDLGRDSSPTDAAGPTPTSMPPSSSGTNVWSRRRQGSGMHLIAWIVAIACIAFASL